MVSSRKKRKKIRKIKSVINRMWWGNRGVVKKKKIK